MLRDVAGGKLVPHDRGMTSKKIGIATYNIHGGFGLDGRFDGGRTLAAIRSLRADIVALQEVDSRGAHSSRNLFIEIEKSLNAQVVVAPTLTQSDGDYGNMLASRWPVRHADVINLSVSGREPRNIISAVVELPDNRRLRVLATHLGLNRQERRYQAGIIAELLDRDTLTPTIMLGDLNEWRRSGPVSRLLSQHLVPAGVAATYPTRLPLWPLDRIWCSSPKLLRNARVVKSPLTRITSDHFPVVADLH